MDEATKEAAIIKLLKDFEPGNLPPRLFEAIGRLSVYPAIEFVPIRERDSIVEVLLFRRPKNDIHWPLMWHTPGTILRPTDESYEDAFERLLNDELRATKIAPPIFLGSELSKSARGRGLLLEYLVVVKGEPKTGKFFDVKNLPDDLVNSQHASIERAVSYYKSSLLK